MLANIFVMLSAAAPEEVILEKLQTSIDNHKTSPSEETKKELMFHLHMAVFHYMGQDKDPMEMISEIERMKERDKLFDVNPS